MSRHFIVSIRRKRPGPGSFPIARTKSASRDIALKPRMKMNQPKLALKYFKRADSYSPYDTIIQKGMADAEAMLKQKG